MFAKQFYSVGIAIIILENHWVFFEQLDCAITLTGAKTSFD